MGVCKIILDSSCLYHINKQPKPLKKPGGNARTQVEHLPTYPAPKPLYLPGCINGALTSFYFLLHSGNVRIPILSCFALLSHMVSFLIVKRCSRRTESLSNIYSFQWPLLSGSWCKPNSIVFDIWHSLLWFIFHRFDEIRKLLIRKYPKGILSKIAW